MRSIEEVRRVLALVEEGLNDCEISRETGIPRGTVRDWRQGKTPRRNGFRQTPASIDDRSCPRCGHPEHDVAALPSAAYAYLLGLYLGDGTISRAKRGVFRLRIVLDAKYPGIIEECASAMVTVCPSSKVGHVVRIGCVEVYSYSRAWPCLFPQHGPGRKHEREIRLVDWQRQIVNCRPRPLLRGLIHSDGSHSVNTIKHRTKIYVYPRYLFSNRSADIRRIFCDACDLEGIEWRVMTETDISIARCESVALMDEFVGPKQ